MPNEPIKLYPLYKGPWYSTLSTVRLTSFYKSAQAGTLRFLRDSANASLNSHNLLNIMLRQIIGGEVAIENINLAESILDICIEHRTWLDKNQESLQLAFFRFLRLIQVQTRTRNS